MVEGHGRTAAERVAKTLLTEHADVRRDAVAMVVAELMEAEISAEIGASHGELTPDRLTHRNGYRPRVWETRVGEFELLIPRKRSGEGYFPSFHEPRRRSEPAIVQFGGREVIGLDIGETESVGVVFLRSIRELGLSGVRLTASNQHTGAGSSSIPSPRR